MSNITEEELTEKLIKEVKLFLKENYFKCFQSILIELSINILAYQKRKLLYSPITSFQSNNSSYSSLWSVIFLLIFPQKEENYINEFNINPICYEYIKALCYKKVKLLLMISINEKIPIKRLVKFYIKLCEQKIEEEKNKKLKQMNEIFNYKKFGKKYNPITQTSRQSNYFFNNSQSKSLNRINKKPSEKIIQYSQQSPQLEYSNSFTRLFIGETDEDSIRERYLSNMVVKKQNQMHLYNSYVELSSVYIKRLYNKIFKKEGGKGVMDKDMINVVNQFENDHRKIEKFQRNEVNLERISPQYDEVKYKLQLELQNQRKKYINTKKKKSSTVVNNLNHKIIGTNSDENKNLNGSIKIKNISKFNNSRRLSRSSSQPTLYNSNKLYNFDNSNKSIKVYTNIKYSANKNKNNKCYKLLPSNSYIFGYTSVKNMRGRNFEKNEKQTNKRKRYIIQNYMNNNDFFFTKL